MAGSAGVLADARGSWRQLLVIGRMHTIAVVAASSACIGKQAFVCTAAVSMGAQNGVATPAPKPLNQMFEKLPTTIFSVMTALSMKHNSINLGFPDDEGPESMKKMAGTAVTDFSNQYPPSQGIPELRQAVARHSEKFNQLPVDWQTETLITVGATEAIAAVLMGVLNAGDEVIVFDPQYDSYACMTRRAGGVVKLVKLNDTDWSVPRDEFRAAFGPRTKMVLVNTPHNPTGRVFSREDLEFIAQLCIEHNVYVLADEVYEHLVFEEHDHVSIRSLPGMADRTLRIGSAGKTFSLTAWKIGYLVGPPPLIAAAAKAHSFLVFTVPSSLQRAVAYGLDHEESFYRQLGPRLEENRRYLDRRLPEIGFRVLPGQGTYFMIADIRPLLPPGSTDTDVDFCQKLTEDVGVTLIPVSALYVSDDPPKHLVRICFCKSMPKLEKACDLMEAHFRQKVAA